MYNMAKVTRIAMSFNQFPLIMKVSVNPLPQQGEAGFSDRPWAWFYLQAVGFLAFTEIDSQH